jgi:DNA gyrase/topoisomerase IV subunit A
MMPLPENEDNPPDLMFATRSGNVRRNPLSDFSNVKANGKIAMTTPVYTNSDSTGNSMEFVLPSKFDLNSIYKPNDGDVKIIESKPGYFASLKYGGYSSSSKVESYTKKLYNTLNDKNIEYIGTPSYVSYNSPYKFFNRRNEIIIEINYSK